MSGFKKCVVPNCENSTNSTPLKIFITVPKQRERRERWFASIANAIGHHMNWQNTTPYFVCEDHFKLEDDCDNWTRYKIMGAKMILKKEVVPHVFPSGHHPSRSQLGSPDKKRKMEFLQEIESKRKKSGHVRQLFSDNEPECSKSPTIESYTIVESPSGKFVVEACKTRRDVEVQVNREVTMTDRQTVLTKEVQVKAKTVAVSVNTTISAIHKSLNIGAYSDSSIESSVEDESTSFVPSQSSEISSDIDNKNGNNTNHIRHVEKHSRFFLGLSKSMYYIVDLLSKEIGCPTTHILITLERIRLADPFFRIGLNFNFSTGHTSKIFNNTLPKIAYLMKQLIVWPEKRSILENMPMQFRHKYKNVQSIIDCYEVEIEKPSDANLQSLTWSSYTNCNTMKYLISATPSSFINFISKGYGGRTSDIAIIKDCQYLDILPENCLVMADRGFKELAPILHKKKCKLVRPPSVAAGEKLSKELTRESKKIASCRVHIERVIRRVREYNYVSLHAGVNIKNVCILDDIMYVVCGLVNLQNKLLNR